MKREFCVHHVIDDYLAMLRRMPNFVCFSDRDAPSIRIRIRG